MKLTKRQQDTLDFIKDYWSVLPPESIGKVRSQTLLSLVERGLIKMRPRSAMHAAMCRPYHSECYEFILIK